MAPHFASFKDAKEHYKAADVERRQCPFCGGADLFAEHGDSDNTYVKCNTCFAEGPALIEDWTDMKDGEAERKAFALWNNRKS